MRRQLAVCLAALGLIAWVDPKTVAPTVSKEAAAAEAKQQALYVLRAKQKDVRRVEDIAFRLQVANQDLCASRRAVTGLKLASRDEYGVKVRDLAAEALGLGEGLTIVSLPTGSPAATAGVLAGDQILSLNGEPVATGKGAAAKSYKRLREILAKSADQPLTIQVRRAGAEQTFTIHPVLSCGYGVVVTDGKEQNAFADGEAIYIERSIIRLAATDEELALVIAHELAHNGQRHVQAQRSNATMAGLGGLLLDGVALASGVDTGGYFTKAGVRIGASHASVEFEQEADYVGMYYLARAGYAIDGVEDFWRKMAVENPQMIYVKTSHPTSATRFVAIAATTKEIDAKRAAGEPLTPNLRTEKP
jgi:Zn-dependent protease with chaperone function